MYKIKDNEYLKSLKKKGIIVFKTGGTTPAQGEIAKTYENLVRESRDIYEELKLGEGLEFITTTTDEHLFGFTFFRMLPSVFGYRINEKKVNYPEDINVKNAVLVTTPSFLDKMSKYDIEPPVKPEVIISAGARLEDEVFRYASGISKRVIDIYGSTETGVIAYRTSPESKMLKLFRGIKIITAGENYTELSTDYSMKSSVIIEDSIRQIGDKIEFIQRCGRVLKIQEKRVISDEMEKAIIKSGVVKEAYCFEYRGKLAALCVLNSAGEDFIIKNDKRALEKKLKENLKKDYEIVPQKWRFYDEVPRRKNGKIDREFIEELFNLNLSLPLVLSRNLYNGGGTFRLCFLNNSNFFKGHFEGYPVLPGVVQLFYANRFARIATGKDCTCGQLRKIKFSNILRPSVEVNLEVKETASGMSFKYYENDVVYSSGLLPIENNL